MYIVISGNIGAGKTSIAQIISHDIGFSVYFEAFESNAFLKDFYLDMKRWSFATQISFLTLRYEQIVNHILVSHIPAVLDRSIYEDREIFAKTLYKNGLLSNDEWNTYDKLYNLMVKRLPPPNLLIYLRRDVDTLLRNIKKRDRSIEKISASYLDSLNIQYEDFYQNWHYPKAAFNDDIYEKREDIIKTIKEKLEL